jgi:hypothetical protein
MQSTQAGRVATPLHVKNGYAPAGVDRDVYGDWNDDPAKQETRVFYLLR